MRTAFIHPDLGIGGAERLVVDAALAAQSSGHEVTIYTSHHDPEHCFKETMDGTLKVVAVGDWLPRRILGKLYALCAIVRMIYVSIYAALFGGMLDVIIVDQVSACIPILKALCRGRILFYCHFPDLLLTQRTSIFKRLYRFPLDLLEEITTGLADSTMVNSGFTAQTFASTFRILNTACAKPTVLYPSLNFTAFDRTPISVDDIVPKGCKVFLSINRYERKKNLALALKALAAVRDTLSEKEFSRVHLVMAGGYDSRVVENVEHFDELVALAKELRLESSVTFRRSFSDDEKVGLLHRCMALIYTPANEHFGIVPVEAMYMRRPVIACNSGGPTESIEDCSTGYLCQPTAESFATKMELLLRTESLQSTLGENGRERIIRLFSFAAFTKQLNAEVLRLGASRSYSVLLLWFPACLAALCAVSCTCLL
ncbi:alpha-1,3/1,6-mannosyltransferase ALG2-like [Sycon ciliatum]|uniref:alpha-1,3/1,6-mannosyltransferase ALG2-like n=1 Tax=Sycon ciliatum TaxID=27933 RepID=UPI0031F61744